MRRDTDNQKPSLQWHPDEQGPALDPEAVFEAGLRNHNIANTAYPIAHRRTIWRYRQEPERLPPQRILHVTVCRAFEKETETFVQ